MSVYIAHARERGTSSGVYWIIISLQNLIVWHNIMYYMYVHHALRSIVVRHLNGCVSCVL